MVTMKTILVPIDLSAATVSVCEAASELAKSLNAKLVLLHIVQPPVITSDYGIPMENLEELVVVSEKAAAKQLSALRDKVAAPGLEVEIYQLIGAPAPLILQEAKTRGADYIVMGSHGHTAFYEFLVGTTTHGVLSKAPCPVVIIPDRTKAKGKT